MPFNSARRQVIKILQATTNSCRPSVSVRPLASGFPGLCSFLRTELSTQRRTSLESLFKRKLQMVSGIRWDCSLLRPALSVAPSSRQATKVDQWANFVAAFPNSQTGTWTISMEWYLNGPPAAGGKTSTLRLKMDAFAVKPK